MVARRLGWLLAVVAWLLIGSALLAGEWFAAPAQEGQPSLRLRGPSIDECAVETRRGEAVEECHVFRYDELGELRFLGAGVSFAAIGALVVLLWTFVSAIRRTRTPAYTVALCLCAGTGLVAAGYALAVGAALRPRVVATAPGFLFLFTGAILGAMAAVLLRPEAAPPA